MVDPERRTPLRAVHSADTSRNVTDELPYRIELRSGPNGQSVELLACARSSALARAIFDAACKEYPDRNIFLSRGSRVIAKRLP